MDEAYSKCKKVATLLFYNAKKSKNHDYHDLSPQMRQPLVARLLHPLNGRRM
jgi:hypothetical protein